MMRAIGQYIPYDSMVVIFGCCGDKDVAGMLERVTHGADKVIFTKVDNIRSPTRTSWPPGTSTVRQDGPGRPTLRTP
jgi:folylpolyglutamate synthase/dihydropteroate synthase